MFKIKLRLFTLQICSSQHYLHVRKWKLHPSSTQAPTKRSIILNIPHLTQQILSTLPLKSTFPITSAVATLVQCTIMPQMKYFDSFLTGFLVSTLVHVQTIPYTAPRMMLLFKHVRSFLSSPRKLLISSHLSQSNIKGHITPKVLIKSRCSLPL